MFSYESYDIYKTIWKPRTNVAKFNCQNPATATALTTKHPHPKNPPYVVRKGRTCISRRLMLHAVGAFFLEEFCCVHRWFYWCCIFKYAGITYITLYNYIWICLFLLQSVDKLDYHLCFLCPFFLLLVCHLAHPVSHESRFDGVNSGSPIPPWENCNCTTATCSLFRTMISGQIIIFHEPRFPWNKGISLPKRYL